MADSERTILITGGTGQVGRAATTALRRGGWRVRVLTRHPATEKAAQVAALGAELVTGDVDDCGSLEAAVRGVYGVFCIPPLAASFMGKDAFERQLTGTQNVVSEKVVDEGVAAGTESFVLVSANSADRGISKNLDNKQLMEEYSNDHNY